jgi:hypothetical protein
MSFKMIPGELDKFLRRRTRGIGENLRMNMAAQLLNPYFVKSSSRWFWNVVNDFWSLRGFVYILARVLRVVSPSCTGIPLSVAYARINQTPLDSVSGTRCFASLMKLARGLLRSTARIEENIV